jgi:hypothetical protein
MWGGPRGRSPWTAADAHVGHYVRKMIIAGVPTGVY